MPELLSHVRSLREAAGLTQAALAERVGTSRQSLSAIESGRSVPSTTLALQLAAALGCPVEALFRLPAPHRVRSEAPLRPGQRVRLGKVAGAWAAHPVDDPACAADALIDPDGEVTPLLPDEALSRQALVAGCAPLMGLLAGHLARRPNGPHAAWLPADSGRALRLLGDGLVHVAGIHLVDADAPQGHAAIVRATLPDTACTLVHLTRWRVGLVTRPGNPLGLRGPDDLHRDDVRFVGRAPGSGAHALLARLLAPGPLPEPVHVAASHAEVAQAVRWGVADAGLAIEAVAVGLGFLPVGEERFDLVVRRDQLDHPAVTAWLDGLDAPAFRREAARLPGYDLDHAGHATTVAP